MLQSLLEQVKQAIFNDNSNPYKQGDSHGLIGQITDMFGQHQQQYGNQPQGMDPYGGVGTETGQFPNVRSSNQDPYGDPANQGGGFGNVKSSNQDPYGDPANQERR